MSSDELESRIAYLTTALEEANTMLSATMDELSLVRQIGDSNSAFRTLVESMQDVVFICDRDWKIESVNAAGKEVFGQSIVGYILTDLFPSTAAVQEFLAEAGSSGSVHNFEAEMTTGHSSRPTVLLNCVAHENGYSGIIKDVTERTRLMDQVIRAQKMESVGTLAAGMAHDFNNILGIIMPNAQLIQLRTPLDPAISKHADVIIAASRRANKLTRQLLSLARRDPIQVRTINLNESIRTTCALAESSLGKQISVHLAFESDPIHVRADDSQMEQILLNLAINARDAMPNGGTLTFQTKREGNEISLRIADTGTGIRKEILPNIFDPFFTTKDKSTGTGLGLSVVYSLVKQIGGSIAVHSEFGCGSEFVLRFPACAVTAGSPRLQLPDPSTGNERILIVDDEPEMRDLLATLLDRMGYDVACANNGMEAVNQVSSEYQLVIMDMMMPVMDGLTAVHAIRQKHPDMKILVASGDVAVDAFPTLRRMNVQGFVQKPFELQKLADLVRDVLDGVAA